MEAQRRCLPDAVNWPPASSPCVDLDLRNDLSAALFEAASHGPRSRRNLEEKVSANRRTTSAIAPEVRRTLVRLDTGEHLAPIATLRSGRDIPGPGLRLG